MGNTKKKKQHYIPQTYLRPFSFLNDNVSIWMYDKQTQKVQQKGIEKICQESYYYSHKNDNDEYDYTAENKFSEIESNFTKIRDKLIKNCNYYNENKNLEEITFEERTHFLEFVSFQWVRVPKVVEQLNSLLDSGFKEIDKNNNEIVTDEDRKNDVKKYLSLGIFKEGFISDIVNMLNTKDWIISIIPDDCSEIFITTDNPVLITNAIARNALINPYTEISLPITPKICISLLANQKESYVYDSRTPDTNINQFNFSMITMSDRFVLSHNKEILDSLLGLPAKSI